MSTRIPLTTQDTVIKRYCRNVLRITATLDLCDGIKERKDILDAELAKYKEQRDEQEDEQSEASRYITRMMTFLNTAIDAAEKQIKFAEELNFNNCGVC